MQLDKKKKGKYTRPRAERTQIGYEEIDTDIAMGAIAES